MNGSPDSTPRPAPRRRRPEPTLLTVAAAVSAALGVLQFHRPPQKPLITPPFAARAVVALPFATPSPDALGMSGEVRLRSVLPRATVEYPLEVRGSLDSLAYQWVRATDTATATVPLPMPGAELVAPEEPGLYHLALVRGGHRRVVDGLTIAVLVPFSEKLGSTLDGYRIGTYVAEKIRGHDHPAGFMKLAPADLALPVSRHFRLSDFVAPDARGGITSYAALNPRLLDKLELVLDALGPAGRDVELDVHVNSGFRPPAYNRTVQRAARDSRHQYGDAADLRIDADGDGRFTVRDLRLVATAVEQVERTHPELSGGLGLYTSADYRAPYAHIDTRGVRVRWQG
ncbi:MAG TPA: D-Ala-D-Ala carboxypeptidase family metallohydrolase [Gemmatimonadaceae bacterium]|nr:D-Ala-D-Ala carboxypeptidase family metallohydrolase [Gemmatimonadaceae bacterium]